MSDQKSQQRSLGKQVLRSVSRSFYLTLRFLPQPMREVTSVGYLLARASDTIADCGGEKGERTRLLKQFREMILSEKPLPSEGWEEFANLGNDSELKQGEQELMRRLQQVFLWEECLLPWQRREVKQVVKTITEGQLWDLDRFGEEGKVVRLESGEELESYCYSVAGCVGEFWTEVGFGFDDKFGNMSHEAMRELGKQYGKGLQLVNILRDVAEDEQRGRRYLPGSRAEWIRIAREHLEAGIRYARAVRDWRVRVATVLPAMLGLETLRLLERATNEDLSEGVKVSRHVLRECVWKALWFR